MPMSTIASSLDFWEGPKNCVFFSHFSKKLNENLSPEDDVIGKNWWQIFLIQDSEYLLDFLKVFWEYWKPGINF